MNCHQVCSTLTVSDDCADLPRWPSANHQFERRLPQKPHSESGVA
jgi:hypothetical protein